MLSVHFVLLYYITDLDFLFVCQKLVGRIHSAQVSSISKRSVTVEWTENGENKAKEVCLRFDSGWRFEGC